MSGLACTGDASRAGEALRSDGAVVLDALWDAAAMARIAALVSARHPEFSDKASLTDMFDNGAGRFIAPVTICPELVEAGLMDHPLLDAVLAEALGPSFVYEAFGMMMADAGCAAQEPHRDGGLLFPETGIDRVLPPASVTVGIPLVPVGPDNAPTAILPGSHRFGEAEEQGEPVTPAVPLGSAILWDFRVLHNGCANTTGAPRPLLYFTASRPFWFDHKNFRPGNRRLLAEPGVIEALGPRYVRAETIRDPR